MNAHFERFFGSANGEGLDRKILFGVKAMRTTINHDLAHYHAERPRHGWDNELFAAAGVPSDCKHKKRIK